jgi:hypothetical protein
MSETCAEMYYLTGLRGTHDKQPGVREDDATREGPTACHLSPLPGQTPTRLGRAFLPWSLDHPRGWPELRREAGTRGPPRAMSERVCRSFAGRPARCSFQAFHQPVLCNDQVDGQARRLQGRGQRGDDARHLRSVPATLQGPWALIGDGGRRNHWQHRTCECRVFFLQSPAVSLSRFPVQHEGWTWGV